MEAGRNSGDLVVSLINVRGVPRGVSRGFRKPFLDFTTTSANQTVYQLYLTKTISIIGKNLTIQ